ncbi:MAG: adenosine deaminase [Chloroflexi bacterium HGW-Chloroflexi-10]|nr:MAG: adenosine deaminase [Chloroflexi bacterium HGW-Chloroflexi-10]
MGWYGSNKESKIFQTMPKIELHRHLEGSLRMDTLLDVARNHGLTIPVEPTFRKMVQVQSNDPLTFENFLSKFQTLRLFYKSPDVIRKVARDAIQDAALDHIQYLELRFTPVALSRVEGFDLRSVMEWVTESVALASQEFNVKTNLIVSVNRHEPIELAEQVLSLALDFRTRGIVGVDLAGNEVQFSALPFWSLFHNVQKEGLKISIHAGEWSGSENVRQAIEEMDADRIGHGVRVMEDESVVRLAVKRQIPFEVCVTSNYQSGVVSSLRGHPILRMIDSGLFVTINTDDPSISQITLGDEFHLLYNEFQQPLERFYKLSMASINAAFLNEDEKSNLREHFRLAYQEWNKTVING